MLVAGCAIVGVYLTLNAVQVLGQPTVVGDGVILLLGYLLVVVGLVWVTIDIVRGRTHRRRSPTGLSRRQRSVRPATLAAQPTRGPR